MASIEFDQAIDNSKKAFVHADSRWSLTYPKDNRTTFTINNISQELIFDLPTADRLVNLSECFVEFDLDVAAQGAGAITALAAVGTPMVSGIRLISSRQLSLADSNLTQLYSKAMAVYGNNTTKAQARPNYNVDTNTYVGAGALNMSSYDTQYRADAVGVGKINHENLPIVGSMYSSGLDGLGLPNAIPNTAINNHKVSYRLGDILPCSLLDTDRVVLYGETLRLHVQFAQISQIGHSVTAIDTMANPLALIGPVTVRDVVVRTAINQNVDLYNQMRARLDSPEGYEMLAPYITEEYRGIQAVNNMSVQATLSPSFGLNALFIMTVAANNSGALLTDYLNFANDGGQLFTSIYDSLGTERLVDGVLSQADLTLWRHMNTQTPGSLALQSAQCFESFAGMIRSWAGRPLHELTMGNAATEETGLSLQRDQLYSVNYVTPGAIPLGIYVFICVQRRLRISSAGGISFV